MTDENDLDTDFIEKRGQKRQKMNADVRVEVDGEVVVGNTEDISLSGCSVNTLVELTTEQFVKLHLEKIGELTGEVVRELEDGFAVEFETVDDNGSVLEERLRSMMGNDEKEQLAPEPVEAVDDGVARERARMEAHLKAMLGGGDDDD